MTVLSLVGKCLRSILNNGQHMSSKLPNKLFFKSLVKSHLINNLWLKLVIRYCRFICCLIRFGGYHLMNSMIQKTAFQMVKRTSLDMLWCRREPKLLRNKIRLIKMALDKCHLLKFLKGIKRNLNLLITKILSENLFF